MSWWQWALLWLLLAGVAGWAFGLHFKRLDREERRLEDEHRRESVG